MGRVRFACVLLTAVLAGCGSDDSPVTGSAGGGTGGSAGQCPSIDGTWTITSHCDAAAVGSKVTVHQKDCKIESLDPWAGWTGGIDSGGGISMSGPAGSKSMTCTGTVSGSSMTMKCDPPCDVQLTR